MRGIGRGQSICLYIIPESAPLHLWASLRHHKSVFVGWPPRIEQLISRDIGLAHLPQLHLGRRWLLSRSAYGNDTRGPSSSQVLPVAIAAFINCIRTIIDSRSDANVVSVEAVCIIIVESASPSQ